MYILHVSLLEIWKTESESESESDKWKWKWKLKAESWKVGVGVLALDLELVLVYWMLNVDGYLTTNETPMFINANQCKYMYRIA